MTVIVFFETVSFCNAVDNFYNHLLKSSNNDHNGISGNLSHMINKDSMRQEVQSHDLLE